MILYMNSSYPLRVRDLSLSSLVVPILRCQKRPLPSVKKKEAFLEQSRLGELRVFTSVSGQLVIARCFWDLQGIDVARFFLYEGSEAWFKVFVKLPLKKRCPVSSTFVDLAFCVLPPHLIVSQLSL